MLEPRELLDFLAHQGLLVPLVLLALPALWVRRVYRDLQDQRATLDWQAFKARLDHQDLLDRLAPRAPPARRVTLEQRARQARRGLRA